jgi:hypothetical protein
MRTAAATLTLLAGSLAGAQPAPSLDALAATLKPTARRQAVQRLAEVNDPRAVELLLGVLARDRDVDVRREAAGSLSRNRDPRAYEALIATLRDPTRQLRSAAAQALASRGDARAVPSLVTALGDGDADVRSSAVFALSIMGDGRAVQPLVELFQRQPGEDKREALAWSKDTSPFGDASFTLKVRLALGEIAERDVAPLVALYPRLPVEGRMLLARVAQTIEPPDGAPLLALAQKDGDETVRRALSSAPAGSARSANQRGMTHYRARDYAGAAAEFRAAIATDDQLVIAHYNLACVAALTEDRATAIEQLKWLAASRNPAARERLRKAASDPDLASVRDDPALRAILPVSAPGDTLVAVRVRVVHRDSGAGDVFVKHADGHEEQLTRDGMANEPRLAEDRRTIAFVVLRPVTPGSRELGFSQIAVVRDGRSLAAIAYPDGARGAWAFRAGGAQLATMSGSERGPAHYQLFDAATGRTVDEYRDDDPRPKPPAWIDGLE